MPAAALQAIAPNRVRARTIALFLLTANIVSFTIGPTGAALISDYVLRDPTQIGVAIATLFQWEAGTSLPSPMAVPALAGALGRDPAALAGLVARERAARLVGGGQMRVVVGRRCHGSRQQPSPAGGRKGGRS
jgi:hypothetical protein